jgi:hypothetical protein
MSIESDFNFYTRLLENLAEKQITLVKSRNCEYHLRLFNGKTSTVTSKTAVDAAILALDVSMEDCGEKGE